MRGYAFTFKCNAEERQTIAALAQRLQRTESDAVRWVVKEAARELAAQPAQIQQPVLAGSSSA